MLNTNEALKVEVECLLDKISSWQLFFHYMVGVDNDGITIFMNDKSLRPYIRKEVQEIANGRYVDVWIDETL